jgi:hypothetical protein
LDKNMYNEVAQQNTLFLCFRTSPSSYKSRNLDVVAFAKIAKQNGTKHKESSWLSHTSSMLSALSVLKTDMLSYEHKDW